MKLYQIEYLMATVESGSISKAADDLIVSRPAVSRAIKDLEDEFGVQFFYRTTAGIALTETGKAFYDKCQQMRHLISEIQNEMRLAKDAELQKRMSKLRVGLSFTAQCKFLSIIKLFMKTHPDIQMEITELSSGNLEQGLIENDLDLEIVLGFEESSEVIDSIPLTESEFVFCCAKEHPLAGRESVTVPDIKDEPLVGLNSLSFKNNQVNVLYARYNLKPNFQYWTSQITMTKQMLREGLCCTIKPKESLINDPDIAMIPFDPPVRYPIRLQWNRRVHHPAAFDTFVEFAQEFAKQKR